MSEGFLGRKRDVREEEVGFKARTKEISDSCRSLERSFSKKITIFLEKSEKLVDDEKVVRINLQNMNIKVTKSILEIDIPNNFLDLPNEDLKKRAIITQVIRI